MDGGTGRPVTGVRRQVLFLRKTAIWARVTFALGEYLPGAVPPVMPVSTSQLTAAL